MKERFRQAPKRHIWFAVTAALMLLFLVGKNSQSAMTWLVDHVTQPFKQGLSAVTYLVPIPLAEILYVGLGLALLISLIRLPFVIRRAENRRRAAYTQVLTLLCAILTVADWFCLAWGINYYADGFQERSGLYAQPVTVEELYRVTELFTEKLNEVCDEVPRDEQGLFAVDREEIFQNSTTVYDNLSEEFPLLARKDREPKKMLCSKLLSAMGFTGYYAGMTGESVLNVDSPACFLPSTIAHELAHQRGIASEQECNFLAVAAATSCDDPVYVYSGYLLGYIHLSNALYKADRELWTQLRQELAEEVLLDIQYNNAYWQQWESPVDTVSQKVYDTFLKSYGQEDGVQSYGTVVDLLVAYY